MPATSAEIRARLPHPIVDVDGHMAEYFPALAPYLEQEGVALDHPGLGRLLPPYSGSDRAWHDQSPEERAATRTPRGPWWSSPAGNTLDLATALFPELLYERLDDLGLDFGVVYPSLGLVFLHAADDEFRRATCRALNRYSAETFAPFADRLAPVAAIPMHTPGEAVTELEYAVRELGFRSVLCAGYVQRPFDALAGADPDVSRYAFWLDQFGVDSQHDYDPVWATAQELGVSVAFHSGFIGMTPYRSTSSYVFNHLSMLAEGQQSLAKSLFLGGVTRRFPRMNFAFLEGGVAWAASLYSDLVGHWEKRNVRALREHLDPALVDRELLGRTVTKYGGGARRVPGGLTNRPPEPAGMLDEFAACGIERAEDIKTLFVDRFWFGCEADDPMTSLAFHTAINPFGAELKAMMGSDIAHWDVPDMTEVVEEAWDMVERGWIDEAAFRAFTFTNPVDFYTGTNPAYFDGTVVEAAVREYLRGR
ncbi:MAG TPA: amidohydrolase family protein [Acidimicrobiia bacterium]|nr:amidohydrolase family protein [Acidimicrobiia bacterium]